MKEATYKKVLKTIKSMVEGESDRIARMSTISCEVFHAFDTFHWVGFYRRVDPETLKVGPYQGSHGCLEIKISRGVCGTCVREAKAQVVNDVSKVADHIACSPITKSEIVLPVINSAGEISAVFDIDSTQLNAFDQTDLEWLERISQLAETGSPTALNP